MKMFFVVVCAHRIPILLNNTLRHIARVSVCVCGFLIAGLPALIRLFLARYIWYPFSFYVPCFERTIELTHFICRRQCDEQHYEMKPINVWMNEGAHDRRSKSIYHWIIIITFCVVVLVCLGRKHLNATNGWRDRAAKGTRMKERIQRETRTHMHKSLG